MHNLAQFRVHRPPVGVLKLNVDAAFFGDERCFGIGLAVRDHEGQLLGFGQMCFLGVPVVKEGEVRAVLEGDF
ncbi:hypothetical protein LINGRAHAP2_LOCUS24900 [Linum grandiflorum]